MTDMADTEYTVSLSSGWITSARLERAMHLSGGPHGEGFTGARFVFTAGCKVMIDAGTRLLSIANQLAFRRRDVTMEFVDGMNGVMGYLDRVSFFDHLDPSIVVVPKPPAQSAGSIRRGNNPDL